MRGIDSQRELALHRLLADGLRAAGYGVFPEQRYPSDRDGSRRSEGRRCDLVATQGARPLFDERAQLALFRLADPCPLDEAMWIEVKVVAQFLDGTPNSAWGGALVAPLLADVRKLAADDRIRRAALLAVLFTADAAIAEHDLDAWWQLARRRALPLGAVHHEQFAIGDRVGNALCTAVLIEVLRP